MVGDRPSPAPRVPCQLLEEVTARPSPSHISPGFPASGATSHCSQGRDIPLHQHPSAPNSSPRPQHSHFGETKLQHWMSLKTRSSGFGFFNTIWLNSPKSCWTSCSNSWKQHPDLQPSTMLTIIPSDLKAQDPSSSPFPLRLDPAAHKGNHTTQKSPPASRTCFCKVLPIFSCNRSTEQTAQKSPVVLSPWIN